MLLRHENIFDCQICHFEIFQGKIQNLSLIIYITLFIVYYYIIYYIILYIICYALYIIFHYMLYLFLEKKIIKISKLLSRDLKKLEKIEHIQISLQNHNQGNLPIYSEAIWEIRCFFCFFSPVIHRSDLLWESEENVDYMEGIKCLCGNQGKNL